MHAYLFVGPAGSTKKEAARAFAALLLGYDDPAERNAELVLRGEHPDVREVARVGASISFGQAREIVRLASLAPIEGDRKLMILDEFHLLSPEGAAILLKTIEEPPPSTTFLVLADFVPHDLITISSRCARIEFRTIQASDIERRRARSVDDDAAGEAAASAGGSIERARVLASDPDLADRRRAFATAPRQLDGSGSTVMRIVDDLLARSRPRRRRSPSGTRTRSLSSTSGSLATASAAAARRRSRSATSESCGGTAPTSCSPASP